MELYTLANASSGQLQGRQGWQFDKQISGGCRVEIVLSCYRTVLQISTKPQGVSNKSGWQHEVTATFSNARLQRRSARSKPAVITITVVSS